MGVRAAIACATEIRPGRYPELDGVGLCREVLAQFLTQWALRPADIDGMLVAPPGMAAGEADVFVHEQMYDELGLHPRFAETLNAGGATFALMVMRAADAIAAGRADSVLCLGAGKFPRVSGGGAERMYRAVSHPDYEFPYGVFIPALYAQVASRHMHEYGTTRQHLAHVAVAQRQWALMHEDALMHAKGPLTVEDVLQARPVATPFHRYDCSIPCEGGAALLVTGPETAKRLNPQPAYLLGQGEHHTHGYISQAPHLTTMGCRVSAELAYREAGLGPQDVELAQIYDAFSINPVVYAEDSGLCAKGKGGELFASGRTAPGGDLPVNTFGGLLSFGHTGDASGLSMIVEGALQVMGRAGPRQVQRAGVCLVHTYGGMMGEHTTLLLGRQS